MSHAGRNPAFLSTLPRSGLTPNAGISGAPQGLGEHAAMGRFRPRATFLLRGLSYMSDLPPERAETHPIRMR